MVTYQLNPPGDYAQKFVDGAATGIWAHTTYNAEYLAWLAAGNTPMPAEE